jgi:hypothetical protein
MNHKIVLALTLLFGVGLLTGLHGAQRVVLCEELYQEG